MDRSAVETLIHEASKLLEGDLGKRFGEPKDAFEQSALGYISQAKVNLGKAIDFLTGERPRY